MTADPKGRGLFIVDNSVSGWTGLRYLEEWAGIAKAFDIATGYFEVGALLALDGQTRRRPHWSRCTAPSAPHDLWGPHPGARAPAPKPHPATQQASCAISRSITDRGV